MPGTTNAFSALKTASAIEVSWYRKVGHSASNAFKSHFVDDDYKEIGKAAFVNANNAVGIMSTSATIAAAAGSTAAFALALSGPQAGITLGLIGIGLLVYEASSDREKAHNDLLPFVWTLIDDVAPPTFTEDTLKTACGAATTLLDDGKAQFKLLKSKYDERQLAFKLFFTELAADTAKINDLSDQMRISGRARDMKLYKSLASKQNALIDKRAEAVKVSLASGGAIFEFVRRCCHVSNYLQAPHILGLGIKEKIDQGSVIGKDREADFFAGTSLAEARKMFKDLDKLMTDNRIPLR
jgi:hypothetical protein